MHLILDIDWRGAGDVVRRIALRQYTQRDAFEETKHPRGQPENKGEFVKKGEGAAPSGELSTTPWQPPDKSDVWPGLNAQQMWEKAREIGRNPTSHESKDLHEALRHLRPGHLNKIDRQHRKAIQVVLALRGELKADPGGGPPQVREPPPKPATPPPTAAETKPAEAKSSAGESIAEVIAKKPNALERHWHEAAWKHATPEFAKVMANTLPLTDVIQKRKEYYQSGRHLIAMSTKSTAAAKPYHLAVWRHEYGHAIDYNGDRFHGRAMKYSQQLRQEGDALVARVKTAKPDPANFQSEESQRLAAEKIGIDLDALRAFSRQITPHQPVPELLSNVVEGAPLLLGFDADHQMHRLMFHDFLGALTLNRIGYGHSTRYYTSRSGTRTAEAFANYVALTQGEHGKTFRALLHSIAPQTCAGFDSLLAETAAKSGPNALPPPRPFAPVVAPQRSRAT